jgi:hypothetical protein
MTETRALTVEEEASLRAALSLPNPHFPGDYTARRLLATLDAERARLSEPAPLDVELALARLERFIDYDYDTGTMPRPMYVTANGVRQEMPRRFHEDALALRAALQAERKP